MVAKAGPPPSAMSMRARGQCLHHLGVAAVNALISTFEAMLLENAGVDADVGRHEGELVGLRLADAELGFGAGPWTGHHHQRDSAGDGKTSAIVLIIIGLSSSLTFLAGTYR